MTNPNRVDQPKPPSFGSADLLPEDPNSYYIGKRKDLILGNAECDLERTKTLDGRKTKGYRKELLSLREGLLGQVQTAESYNRERDAEATQDTIDMASDSHTKALIALMSVLDRQLLISIDTALDLIANGKYGDCVECGDVINEKRLAAIPWAKFCLNCQDLSERELLSAEEAWA